MTKEERNLIEEEIQYFKKKTSEEEIKYKTAQTRKEEKDHLEKMQMNFFAELALENLLNLLITLNSFNAQHGDFSKYP